MLRAKLTTAQERELSALSYWVADVHYIAERYGADDPEHEVAHKTVLSCFAELDRLGVPWWLQNAVVMFAEDWRRYKSDRWLPWLNRREGYNVEVLV